MSGSYKKADFWLYRGTLDIFQFCSPDFVLGWWFLPLSSHVVSAASIPSFKDTACDQGVSQAAQSMLQATFPGQWWQTVSVTLDPPVISSEPGRPLPRTLVPLLLKHRPCLSLSISASGQFLKPTSYPSSFGLSWGTSEWHRERVQMASKYHHQPTGTQDGISIDPLSCPSEEQFRDTFYTISQRVLVLCEMETCLFIAIISSNNITFIIFSSFTWLTSQINYLHSSPSLRLCRCVGPKLRH